MLLGRIWKLEELRPPKVVSWKVLASEKIRGDWKEELLVLVEFWT